MDNKKSAVPAPPGNGTTTTFSADTIAQDVPQSQGVSAGRRKKKWSHDLCKILNIDSKVFAVALKFYDEQLPFGWQYVVNVINATDPKLFHVIAIMHYKDTYRDGSFWKSAVEKPHYHIIVRCVGTDRRIRIGSLLRQLGVEFRKGLDNSLIDNHAIETVVSFAGYATYLTHETEDAIRDGKELYDRSELISNLSEDELERVRQGYIRVKEGTRKLSPEELVKLDQEAYDLGYDLGNFEAWTDEQPFNVRSHPKFKTFRESYSRGVRNRVDESPEVLRLFVFITGDPGTGKTYACREAFKGKKVLTVEASGTGKFDKLTPDTDVILVSDDVCPNLLAMTDNYICQAYRRRADNPAWTGEYFVVTSNLGFRDWLEECGIQTRTKNGADTKHYAAMLQRAYICEVKANADGSHKIVCKQASTRGSVEEQRKRMDMFIDFQTKVNASMAEYRPTEVVEAVDYTQVIDYEYLSEAEQFRKDPDRKYAEIYAKLKKFTAYPNGIFWCSDSNVAARNKFLSANQLPDTPSSYMQYIMSLSWDGLKRTMGDMELRRYITDHFDEREVRTQLALTLFSVDG